LRKLSNSRDFTVALLSLVTAPSERSMAPYEITFVALAFLLGLSVMYVITKIQQ
jgi:hypothetical protein